MKCFYAAMAAAILASGLGCSAVTSCGSACDTPFCGAGMGPQVGAGGGFSHGRPHRGAGLFSGLGKRLKGCGSAGCGEVACDMPCVPDAGGCAMGCDPGCGCEMGGGCGPMGGGVCQGVCGNCGSSCLQNMLGVILDCPGCGCGSDRNYNFTPGPPVGQTAYPYYTTRGPRDFLMANPPTIGPR